MKQAAVMTPFSTGGSLLSSIVLAWVVALAALSTACTDDDPPGSTAACEENERLCEGTCTDVQSDAMHCGACNHGCGSGEICVDGACKLDCTGGRSPCEGECVDLQSDPKNCGTCGQACAEGEVCSLGSCASSCDPGLDLCGGGCVDTSKDSSNCGACGTVCGENRTCDAGACICEAGLRDCNGVCVDTSTDPENCGDCNVSCLGQPNTSGGVCDAGECQVDCNESYADCSSEAAGCETFLEESLAHCGACDNDCSTKPRTLESECSESACHVLTCEDGWADCDQDGENGCEVDLNTVETCGSCDQSCEGLPNNRAAAACVNFECVLECDDDWVDCDGDFRNGCESPVSNDRENCGGCGDVCTTVCEERSCQHIIELTSRSTQSNCVIMSSGSLYCWGANRQNQLGRGANPGVPTEPGPVYLPGGEPLLAKHVAAGADHVCAVLLDGKAVCWGSNEFSKLGNGSTDDSSIPVYVQDADTDKDLEDVEEIAVSRYATCARLKSGQVKCWGWNLLGALGRGDYDFDTVLSKAHFVLDPKEPTKPLGGVTEVQGGSLHFCVRMGDDRVHCWGINDSGLLGTGAGDEDFSPWAVEVEGIATAKQIAAGGWFNCARLEDRTVSCWGSNSSGTLGVGRGESSSPTPVQVKDLEDVVDLSVSDSHACAVLADGTARCWGDNDRGQCGDGTEDSVYTPTPVLTGEDGSLLQGVQRMITGSSFSCALLEDSSISCWGSNTYDSLGNPDPSRQPWPTPVEW